VTGASHVRGAVVCQDHSVDESWDAGEWAMVAVADGHGSEGHFRSQRGAAFAVAAMRQVFASFRDLNNQPPDVGTRIDWRDAPRILVKNWRARVLHDLVADPPRIPGRDGPEPRIAQYFDDYRQRHGHAALHKLFGQFKAFESYAGSARERKPGSYGPGAEDWDADLLGNWHLRAYGSTILGVLIGPAAIHWLQLGDGAMMKVIGGEPRYLCPPPAEALANATPSLCDNDAMYRTLVGTQHVVPGAVPSAVILATDGVPNSFDDHEGFLKFCVDVSAQAVDAGDLRADLLRWLPEISRRGSGDDMSVSMAWATERPASPSAPQEGEVTHLDASEAGQDRNFLQRKVDQVKQAVVSFTSDTKNGNGAT